MSKIVHPFKGMGDLVPFIDNKYETASPLSESVSFLIGENTPVYSMVDSVVTEIKEDDKLGKIVMLKSSNWNYSKKTNKPLYQTYCHLNSIQVKKGDSLIAGDEIGTTGKTGSLASSGTFTVFFSIDESTPKIKSIDVSAYPAPENLEFKDLDIKNTDGTMSTLKSSSLRQYIHKIFGQTPETNAKTTPTIDLSGEDIELVAAIAAQENAWGGNDPSDMTIAKTESTCRVIRNRAYKVSGALVDVALGLREQPYDTNVENFSGSLSHEANIRGTRMNFLTFVTNVVGGIDYDYIEDNAVLRPNYIKEELYGITGFMSIGEAESKYPGSIVATLGKDYACMNWKFYPSNSNNTVNDKMPAR